MKICEQWLREWVNPPISSAELITQLTMAGLEVAASEPAASAFTGVVVGRVVELTAHPQAERLQIAKVDIGQSELLQVVCAAPNVHLGMLAPTAQVGAILPGDIKIKKTTLRGITSEGILCSAKELGLAESAEGLLSLPSESLPGTDVRALLQLDSQVIEIDLTPNRGDCLGVIGIAREVGVLNRCEVKSVVADPVKPTLDTTFPVTVSAPEDCPRYVGRVVRQINPTAETPLYIRERLRRAGLRSLSPVVDVTNYVMLELSQPMHAFDLAKLSGGINVRHAKAGETLVLLNGEQLELESGTLLITDHHGPLALAGIMGGQASGVDNTTRDLFLESAFFSPITISGRARRYGLHTDSSHRFERGVDPQLQARALERATHLLMNITGGQPGPLIEVVFPQHLPAEPAIRLRPERIQRLLGLEIAAEEVEEILHRLGMAVAVESDHWIVVPPSFRFDITIEADLIEEIGRIYGYSRIPSKRPLVSLGMPPQPEHQLDLSRLRETLVQRGFQEAITYSFVDPTLQKLLDPLHTPLALSNPISSDLAVMRTNLWPGLIKTLLYNQKRQQTQIRLFECGLSFVHNGDRLVQDPQIAAVVCGSALEKQWGVAAREVDFFDLKADVEALLSMTGRGETFSFVAAHHPALHPGQTARIEHNGNPIGWIGALHPAVERAIGTEAKIYVFELSLPGLGDRRIPQFVELSKFPVSHRDIAIVVAENITAQAVQDCIRAHGTELLREVYLFDVYCGKGIPEGHKSMAFGLILQDFSCNLTEAMIDNLIAKVVLGLEQKFGATLRV
jgi:phenylalanyl-tRNA synthetase beta chain